MPRTSANASGVAVAAGEAFVSVLVVAGWRLHAHVTSAQTIIIKKDPRKLILYPSAIFPGTRAVYHAHDGVTDWLASHCKSL